MARRLAAIVAIDIVGYSRLMGGDEAGTLARLKSLRSDIVQPKVAAHGGRIVKLMGDGLLVAFSSVVEAVECAVEIQRSMADWEVETPEGRRIRLRVGINFGDIIVDEADIFGDGVNVAARLEGLAEAGGICISGKAYEEVKNKLDLAFEAMGAKAVKNILEPVQVYRWLDGGRTVPGAPTKTGPLRLPDQASIAVLPFANVSDSPEHAFFSYGLAEDIITELSRFRSLFVIARNSSFAFKDQAVDVHVVASQLGVRYVLEGSVRTVGNRVRVTAQLIDASTRKQVWAERYDRTLEGIFELQDEITGRIVAAIEPELSGAERERARRAPPDNLDAWGLYQRGLWHVYKFTAEDNAEARALFERATAADPNFAPAYAGLSFTYFSSAFLGYEGDRKRNRDLALDAARRSVSLDDRGEAARWALGRAYMIRGDHDRAVAELETAVELNPNYAHAHYSLGWSLVSAGRHAEALPYLDRAERLSPRDPLLFAFCAVRAQALYHLCDFDRALEEARRAARQPNAHMHTRALLAAVLGALGRLDEARAERAQVLAERPDYARSAFAMSFPYRRAEDLNALLDGLAAAGLPE